MPDTFQALAWLLRHQACCDFDIDNDGDMFAELRFRVLSPEGQGEVKRVRRYLTPRDTAHEIFVDLVEVTSLRYCME